MLIGLVDVSLIALGCAFWVILAVQHGAHVLIQLVIGAFVLIGAALLAGALLCGVYLERKDLVTPHLVAQVGSFSFPPLSATSLFAQTVTIFILFVVFFFLILGYRGGPLSEENLKRRFGAGAVD